MDNNETVNPLHDHIRKIVGNTLAEAKLGTSPEFEGYVADKEAERILSAIAKTHLSLSRILKLQNEFAGVKRKYVKKNKLPKDKE